jgi:hypothetical protein
MKWFLGVCAFVGVVGIGLASCGPKKDFCPTKTDNICFFEDGGPMGGAGGQDQGPCDGGPQLFCQNGMPVCSLSQCN